MPLDKTGQDSSYAPKTRYGAESAPEALDFTSEVIAIANRVHAMAEATEAGKKFARRLEDSPEAASVAAAVKDRFKLLQRKLEADERASSVERMIAGLPDDDETENTMREFFNSKKAEIDDVTDQMKAALMKGHGAEEWHEDARQEAA